MSERKPGVNEHSNGNEQEEDAHGSEQGVTAGHGEGEDRPQAEARAEAQGQEGAGHDQPFTGATEGAGETLTA